MTRTRQETREGDIASGGKGRGGNGRAEERKSNGSDLRTSEPLCSLIKPGVARLGGVCAVAGGVRVAPRWSNGEAEGMEGGRGPGDRGRLHRGGGRGRGGGRVSVVAGTRCVGGGTGG